MKKYGAIGFIWMFPNKRVRLNSNLRTLRTGHACTKGLIEVLMFAVVD